MTKREAIIHLAQDNPINLDIVFQEGDFPTRKAAAVWLNRQENSGVLNCVGVMKDNQGRRVLKVYCNGWKPKDDNLRHEIIGTLIRLLYPLFWFARGYKLSDCYPDMVMTDDEVCNEIEIDCGTEKRPKIQGRWKSHKCDKDILVVIAPKKGDPEARLKQLLHWSQGFEQKLFFTTLDRLKTHGAHKRVWDYVGRGDEPLKFVEKAVSTPFQCNTDDTP